MEQDIEILEELLNAKITFTISPTDYGWKALEHLIKAYKELEYKYNKALSDLVQAEHKNKELKEENENLKLKERNRVLGRYGEIEVHDLINETLADDYIPVSLVEEKIEEINKLITEAQKELGSASKEYTIYVYQKDILQELLEKRK